MRRGITHLLAALAIIYSNIGVLSAGESLETGNTLIENMRYWERSQKGESALGSNFREGLYSGYVVGVADSLSAKYCASGEVAIGQYVAVVAKYLNGHPEKWNQPASTLVLQALKEAFPCKK